ncbi:MAG TPA: hypothetical protein VK141_04605 [Nitrosomonas sp.]|nr:hypothetical protein [Nitrosomonas sp.]
MMIGDHFSQFDQVWFDHGKEDAWAGKSKQPPEHDPQAASFYDLGYSEGEIGRPPTDTFIASEVEVTVAADI